jgi:4-carboxymuconolactone decarboxylase
MSYQDPVSGRPATFGRYVERTLDEMNDDEKAVRALLMEARGMVPGPYRILLQNRRLTEALLPLAQHYQSGSSLSKAEIEIAVLLTTSKWMAAYATSEHEWLAERLGGLAPDQVEALVTGRAARFEDPRQNLVYDLSCALLAPRIISSRLHRRAIDLLGDVGLTDVIAIIGYFTTVAMTLCAYDVPAHAEGLERPGEPTVASLKARAQAATP